MTSRAARLCLLGLAAALPFSSAFSPLSASGRRTGTVSRSALFVEPDPDTLEDLVEASRRDKPGLDGDLRTKLIAETIAPWRTLRLFLYGSLGSGARIGSFVTLTAVLALQDQCVLGTDLHRRVHIVVPHILPQVHLGVRLRHAHDTLNVPDGDGHPPALCALPAQRHVQTGHFIAVEPLQTGADVRAHTGCICAARAAESSPCGRR
mmetsp:Transcript_22373/g.44782  ORF Transcript_22373/g.44782 Transcript_22373/m.44782 type:complete len:207 (-) Transcript_22373:936-1556(-)